MSRDETYHDIFVTALEGGIGYWSTCSEYHWSADDEPDLVGFRAVIREDQGAVHTIDRATIRRGAQLYVMEYRDAEHMRYFQQAAKDLRNGAWDDLDIDALIADVIVQLGLFGKVLYG